MKLCKSAQSLVIACALVGLSGCTGVVVNSNPFNDDKRAAQIKKLQTRTFDTTDTNGMLRTVIATLQHLEFVVDTVDAASGSVSTTKISGGFPLYMTVTVSPTEKMQLRVHAIARYGQIEIGDPEIYQSFFTFLSKAMGLNADNVK